MHVILALDRVVIALDFWDNEPHSSTQIDQLVFIFHVIKKSNLINLDKIIQRGGGRSSLFFHYFPPTSLKLTSSKQLALL